MADILQIKNLKKTYGDLNALNGINLSLEEGKLLGLLGPNGSGKTTLIKIIMGLIKPDQGEVRVDGKLVGVETKKIISYLPDAYHLYDNLTIKDAINLYNDFYDDFSMKICKDLMDFMQIPKKGYAEKLSKGMKERLLLTLTLSRKTKMYILDEPIEGVDPIAKEMILSAIINTIDIGRTIIITTHQVQDLENLFDDVALLRDGNVIIKDDAEKIREVNSMSISQYYREIFG
ncbi:MAG: ATP-binding cassette domain-containing protein [Tissierellia bacterium]|nr:ATP-binding cassette domain-containing protein [Tissierellia bacterium]